MCQSQTELAHGVKMLLYREGSCLQAASQCVQAKTRQRLCGYSRVLRTPTSQDCSAGGHKSVCLRHFNQIRREDDKTRSHPSS